MAVALTYRTSEKRGALRTVIVNDDIRDSVVLLPSGSLDVVTAKLLEGTSSRHSFWAEVLSMDPANHQFIVPAAQVVARREITVATIVKTRKDA